MRSRVVDPERMEEKSFGWEEDEEEGVTRREARDSIASIAGGQCTRLEEFQGVKKP